MSTASPPPIDIDLGARSYAIHFGDLGQLGPALERAGLRAGRCLIVTDENVAELYLDAVRHSLSEAGWTPHAVVVAAGEATKAPGPLRQIYDEALSWGIDRSTPVVALGGGVVGDLAGFAAATLLRGLPLVQVPTTCIAQVDSAIGGKTGINHAAGKNLIGAFHQPALIYADAGTLQTLPRREWTSGLAEVVKHALIADTALAAFIDRQWDAILDRDERVLPELMHRGAAVKAEVVSADEREQGRRAILNFGHTFGHALERVAGYGTFTHGEAVAIGMRAALHLSHTLEPAFPLDETVPFVDHIPTPPTRGRFDVDALMEAMKTDKKVRSGIIRYVVLREPGQAYVTTADEEAARAAWTFALERPS